MKLYGAIDLHSNNAVSGLINEQDEIKMRKRNTLPRRVHFMHHNNVGNDNQTGSTAQATGYDGIIINRLFHILLLSPFATLL